MAYPLAKRKFIIGSMAYDIGQHIDLSYLNKKREVAAPANKKSSLYVPGTRFVFTVIENQLKAAISIPVVFA